MSTGLIVASGKVTVSPDELVAALGHHVKTLEHLAPNARRLGILSTEVSPDKYNEPLRDLVHDIGWWMFHPHGIPGADECAILSSVPLEDHAAWRLTEKRLTRETTNRTAPIVLTGAKMVDGPWLSDWHTPAHNGGLDTRTWPARVYLDALEGLRVASHEMGHDHDGKLVAADWNIALERGEIRQRLGRPYPHMEWSWHRGQGSTEGGRVIDGFLTNLPIREKAETLPRQPGFDHHAVYALLGEAK